MTRKKSSAISAGLPTDATQFMTWDWPRIQDHFEKLINVDLDPGNLADWLDSWTHLHSLISESYSRLHVASAANTRDSEAEKRFQQFLESVYLPSQPFEENLKSKLLESGLEPPGFERPLQNMRADREIFRPENLPLFAEEEKLSLRYSKIIGEQTIRWQGKELTLQQLKPFYQSPDRGLRERAWSMAAERQIADRGVLNDLWCSFLALRDRVAETTGLPGYRDYRWAQLHRFDYRREDCSSFHEAIESVVVPATGRIYERRRQKLGVESLRPWDVEAHPPGEKPLRPFSDVKHLVEKAKTIFTRVDRQLGDQFRIMRLEGLLDLENRAGKAPGGFCTYYPVQRRPFIFMNAVGLHDDVKTLLHEAGHAFHDFAAGRWFQQWQYGTEFAEVASMSMELLSSPFLAESHGGFYSEKDAARARIGHLESIILFWPYMAVVDGFQLWAYENSREAADPGRCDAKWSELWDRFMRGIDYSGLDDVKATGWHRKLHIFQYPLYYIEYGLAQLGAVQVWGNSLDDYSGAVGAYKHALALGAQPLPLLFKAAGARFAFDVETLETAVGLIEHTIEELRPMAEE